MKVDSEMFRKQISNLKQNCKLLAGSSAEKRNKILQALADTLEVETEVILAANKADLEQSKGRLTPALLSRLNLTEKKLFNLAEGLRALSKLPDPLNKEHFVTELDEGLVLKRITVPLGLVACVFESRPDALPQILGICIKTGNGLVFKAGKESQHTIDVIVKIFTNKLAQILAVEKNAIPLLSLRSREEFSELLNFEELIDIIIPRGSKELVQEIMANSKVPVLAHADGVCHVYVEKSANFEQAIKVILDSKLQYPAACNACEVLLLDQEIAEDFLPKIVSELTERSVEIFVCDQAQKICTNCQVFPSSNWHVEFSDQKLAIKIVAGIEEAIEHINNFGSKHTDCIITNEDTAKERFFSEVDAANIFSNCSTRFADGFRYGFGAEVGISTSKLHARGPVGIDGLCTYKNILEGHGQIVEPYETGQEEFTHRKLK